MKTLITSVIVSIFMVISGVAHATPSEMNWFWHKMVYTADGLPTTAVEVVKYRVTVDGDFDDELKKLNVIISTIALSGQFSNLKEMESLINRAIRYEENLSGFTITDVYVDER